jgi:hypothetical protein
LLTQDWSKQNAAAIVSKAALVLTFAFTFWRSRGVWKSPVFEDLLEAGAQILLFYLLVTCLWFQNWYSLWLAGFVPLLRPGLTRRLALLVGFATLSKPLAIGPKLFWPQTKLAQPWLEIYFTLGVLGVPWIYWLLSSWKTKRDCAAEQS